MRHIYFVLGMASCFVAGMNLSAGNYLMVLALLALGVYHFHEHDKELKGE